MSPKTVFTRSLILFVFIGSACTPSLTDLSSATVTPVAKKPTVDPSPILPSTASTKIALATLVVETPTPTMSALQPDNAIPHFNPGHSVAFTEIHMVDAGQGWAIAHGDLADHILRTEDGGNSWQDIMPPEAVPTQEKIYKQASAAFMNAETAFVAYSDSNMVWRTKDGGLSWQSSPTEFEAGMGTMILFIDKDHGWLMKFLDAGMSHVYTALFSTSDGGDHWLKLLDPYSDVDIQSFDKTGLSFADSQTGWLSRDAWGVMDGAFIDWTYDGGVTWESQQLPPPSNDPDLFNDKRCGVYFPSLSSLAVGNFVLQCVGYEAGKESSYNYLYLTSDGGKTWETYPYPGGDLHFIDKNVAWAISQELNQSLDGGRTWTKIKTVKWDGQFSFVNTSLAWAVAVSGDEIALVKTTNGCHTFDQLYPQIIASEAPSSGS